MTQEDKGLDFSSSKKVIWGMFTLITCNLVILSGILRQAKGELKFFQHILEQKTLPSCVTGLAQSFLIRCS